MIYLWKCHGVFIQLTVTMQHETKASRYNMFVIIMLSLIVDMLLDLVLYTVFPYLTQGWMTSRNGTSHSFLSIHSSWVEQELSLHEQMWLTHYRRFILFIIALKYMALKRESMYSRQKHILSCEWLSFWWHTISL